MEPLTAATLQGTWSTLLLPLSETDDILWDGITHQLQALAEAEVDGIYFNGTACEFYAQSNGEFLRLAQTTAGFCEENRIPFQIGASHAHAAESLKRIEQTHSLQPGAFQVILPEWTPLQWDEILRFLERMIAAAAPIPLVIYNPPTAQKILSPSEWKQIADSFISIIGIKVAGGDTDWHEQMRPAAEKLSVFVAGIRLASGVITGCAKGSYSNLACLSPSGANRYGRLIRDNPEKALQQEAEILKVFGTALAPYRGKVSNTALDKALAAAGGWTQLSPRPRWPLAGIPATEVDKLATLFREGLPFLFEENPSIA